MTAIRRMLAFVLFGAALAYCAPAFAQAHGNGRHGNGPPSQRPPAAPPGRHAIPEFDPTAAGAIAAIVGGGGLLVARRRKR